MFNIGGGELLIIFLVALVVLGPTKLPEAARQVGKVMGEFRRMSAGFQNELKSAMDDPVGRAIADAEKPDVRTPTKPSEDHVDVTKVAAVPPIPDAEPVTAESAPGDDEDASDGASETDGEVEPVDRDEPDDAVSEEDGNAPAEEVADENEALPEEPVSVEPPEVLDDDDWPAADDAPMFGDR